MTSAYENAMNDKQAESYTQKYPVVVHQEISTAHSIAINCNHCENLNDTCGECTIKMLKSSEAAEARAAELESHLDLANAHAARLMQERDELRRQLTEAQHAIGVLSNTVVAQDATIKQLEQAREDVTEYRAEIARLTRKAATIPPHTQEALNEGDGVYRP